MKFSIRILTKRLHVEQTLAAKGADRFAPKRVKELKEAIELLQTQKQQISK